MAVSTENPETPQATSAAPEKADGGKLRAFVIQRGSGEPVSGVTVLAKAGSSGGTATLGVLSSDHAGYVSFDVSQAADADELWLELANAPRSKAVLATPGGSDGAGPLVLEVDAADLAGGSRNRQPSIESPDVRDWELSPNSFVQPSAIELGEEGCRIPVPVVGAIRTIRYFQVVRSTATTAKEKGKPSDHHPAVSAPAGSLSLEPLVQLGDAIATAPLLCEILDFEQRWFDLGHSLGSVVYSLPLAPCESVNLAVIEAARADVAERADAVLSEESLLHELRRDRTIAESVDAMLHESQQGWSVSGGVGIPVGGGLATIGAAASRSWGSRDVSSDALQELHDKTVQATGVVRSLNSTVVVQATQAESHQLETRTVTNHNHCHALTVQYYEVLRRIRLETRYVGSRPAILVPYPLLRFTQPYPETAKPAPDPADLRLVNRLRPLIENELVRPELRINFESVRRLLFFAKAKPPAPPPPTPPADYNVQFIRFRLARGEYGTGGTGALRVAIRLRLKDGSYVRFANTRSQEMQSGHPWKDDLSYFLVRDRELDGEAEPGYFDWLAEQIAGFFPSPPIFRSQLDEIQVHWNPHFVAAPGKPRWSFRGIDLRVQSPQGEVSLVEKAPTDPQAPGPEFADFQAGGGMRAFKIPPVAPPEEDPAHKDGPTSSDKDLTPEQDEALAWELIAHLHEHRAAYSRYIVEHTDPTWFASALAKVAPGRGVIDPLPLAISGPYVLFALDAPLAAQRPPAPRVDIVSLPTRGLLAEAQLGTCNSCEQRDVTRFWRWEESPCPEHAPAIEGITPGFRGQPPTIEPATLPMPVVQIQQPPAAPDPVGLAAALQLLGQPNIFRDMSGRAELAQLLGGLTQGAISLEKARQLAATARQKLEEGAAPTGGDLRGAPPRQRPEERYDNLGFAKALADAAPELGLDKEMTSGLIRRALGDGDGAGILAAAGADGGTEVVGGDAQELRWAADHPDGRVELRHERNRSLVDLVVLWNFGVGSADVDRFMLPLQPHEQMLKGWADSGDILEFAGHASTSGREDANVDLSLRRATRVRDWFIGKFGTPISRTRVSALGASRPDVGAAAPFSDEYRARNRRAEIRWFRNPMSEQDIDQLLARAGTLFASPIADMPAATIGRIRALLGVLRRPAADDRILYAPGMVASLRFWDSLSNRPFNGYEWLADPDGWALQREPRILIQARQWLGEGLRLSDSDGRIITTFDTLDDYIRRGIAWINLQLESNAEAGPHRQVRLYYEWVAARKTEPNSVYSVY